MSTLKITDIIKIADLAKLNFSDEKLSALTADLENIMKLVEKMNLENTDQVEPLSHSIDISQPMREDIITEKNQRDIFLQNAPETLAGLYIVPKFLETE